MLAYYTDEFVLPLPANHRFPMQKYALLRKRILETGIIDGDRVRVPPAVNNADLSRVHTADYIRRALRGELSSKEVRALGFPWSPQLVERSRRSCGATLAAARYALSSGVAANLAGGTHHAYADRGEGFCLFNDAAITIRALQASGEICRAAVIDCDVHQGNGTAMIFSEDDTVFTMSIHGHSNYPLRKEQSDLDIGLEDRTGDIDYLEAVRQGVDAAVESRPDLVIYLAGADPFEGDRLGRLSVSKVGLRKRDQLVFSACSQAAVPVAVAMSGGYAPDVNDTVDIHVETIRQAAVVDIARPFSA